MQIDEIRSILYEEIKKYGYRRFCRDAEISTGTISFWQHGKGGINLGTLIRALDVLGYEIQIVRKWGP